jgi:hypothetical protein
MLFMKLLPKEKAALAALVYVRFRRYRLVPAGLRAREARIAVPAGIGTPAVLLLPRAELAPFGFS